jgi:Tol biopolymer transport system component
VSYYARIALFSLLLALTTAGLALFGPRGAGITLAAKGPNGQEAPAGSPIRLTFSRPVDRRSAEASFRIDPPAPGRFFWEEQTLTFQPALPLSPDTEYTVTLERGLQDDTGRPNGAPLSWSFRTRGPRLLVARAADDGASELWLVAPDGQGARQLLRSPDGISDLAVAPDGVRALYVELRGLERSALMLLDLESGATRPLADDPTFSAAGPAWAPAGDFITFERRALTDGGLGVPRVWLAQPDGSLFGALYAGDGGDISYGAAWSPDGNSVAFVDGISQELKIYDFISDMVAALPARTGERASWLPDGAALIFSSAEAGEAGLSLRLRRVEATEPYEVSELGDGEAAELAPAVSPDGQLVAYTRRAPDRPESAIWVAPAGGGPGRRLTSEGPHMDTQPVWSPVGRSVAFVRSSAAGPRSSAALVVDVASGEERAALEGAVLLAWAP